MIRVYVRLMHITYYKTVNTYIIKQSIHVLTRDYCVIVCVAHKYEPNLNFMPLLKKNTPDFSMYLAFVDHAHKM